MQLSDLSVRRPVFAAVVAVLLCIVGVVGYISLSVREYPDTDPPIVSVETSYTGAAASVVETRITQLIEDAVAGVQGIQTITSTSQDGTSNINIEFDPSRDIDSAANDVRDRVGSVTEDLPEDALAPEIRKVDSDARAILFIAFSRPGWSPIQISDYLDRNVVDRFAAIDGVARANISGEARPSTRVWFNAERLAAFGLTPADVETALRSQNVELPAGRFESRDQNQTLRVERPFATPDQFAQLVVGRGTDGYQVKLGDVARIEEAAENPYSSFRSNQGTAIGIGIIRQSGANTLDVAQKAKALIAELKPTLPQGMRVAIGTDESLFIERAIDNVYDTLIEAALLVILVIFLFLGSVRATIIPAITVPICLLATCAVMWLLGLSINLLTLLAFVLAIGLVVDDAIVVLENVYHRIEQGEDPLVAAYLGTRQVGFAIISTTLVVCAVFVPVMFLAGQTGLLFRELAIAMIAAIAFSGFISLSLAPMLCSKLLRTAERGRLARWVDARFQRLEDGYARWLDAVLRRPLLPLAGVLIFLAIGGFFFTRLPSELAPAEDTGVVEAQISAPEGTGFNRMMAYMRKIEDDLAYLRKDGTLQNLVIRTPAGFGATDDFNGGNIIAFLRPWEDRTITTAQVATVINKVIADQPGVRGNAAPRSGLGRGRGLPVNIVLAGSTYEGLVAARNRIVMAAADYPGLINLDSDYKESKPQMRIETNLARAGDLGVSVDDVSQALQSLLGSRRVGTYVDRGEEYRVLVQAEDEGRETLADLERIHVRSRTGVLVPLSTLVTVKEVAGPRQLNRYNKLRAITLTAALAPGTSLGEALGWLEEQARQSPEVLALGYRGESQSLRETGSAIWLVFGLTIVIVFLLLAAQFESFIHPGVIIATVPLAVAGGVIGLAITGGTINLYSQIGIVMLVGLAAKNGILIVEFANQLRDEGLEIAQAIREAATRRLRPILMTSIATVIGAVPLVIRGGAGAAARHSIGVVVVFGVSLATLITLFLIPIFYSRVAKRTVSPQTVSRKLESALKDSPEPAE
ncbi:MAG TPA: AcrB/AcrD/AcrF family protein [Sphingobium sp.]|uniref:efflux RND transporter permease subunit n=1 Tax=unclassified Sphingobium TaxID=2611147 RepID=UPI0007F40E6D|nr:MULTISPECIES: efflux RND transporter permease subunit [unclassified Sphingobium]OAN57784.1 multidrug transporter AcrB [Sphingobium sp. TCM1]WIW87558.1 efflux RND transporter permease subunit [Sphingobium sp. V4]HAF41936.1 AcrB/AcrD/AcrF family protein [Sphingobium sp.]